MSSTMRIAASRCCNQLQLAKQFWSSVSISTTTTAVASLRLAPKSARGFTTRIPLTSSSLELSSLQATKIISPVAATGTDSDFMKRYMATNRKVIDAKNARRLKIQQKKKKNANKPSAASNESEEETTKIPGTNDPFLQHQEWVKFQQSITVEGFQTGQTTTATALKKSRGGKQARRKREKELARLGALQPQEENLSAVAQKFPAIRYSPEETEELLKLAYETLPERTGKRGTRNLRRQAERWRRVRKIRSDYKAHIEEAHFRRMEARKYKRDRTKAMKEAAPGLRRKDLEYQKSVLERWMESMTDVDTTDIVASKASQDETALPS